MNQRYHKLLLTEDLLKPNAKYLATLFQELWLKYTHKQISDTEFCAIYLLSFQLIRSPQQPFIGFKHPPLCSQTLTPAMSLNAALETIASFVPNLGISETLPKAWPLEKSIIEVLNTTMLKGIPRSGVEPLIQWHANNFSLFLLAHIPTAAELLQFQIEGRRCVTALITEDELLTVEKYFGRDPFSFLLHDFFHAEHFMGDKNHFKAQIGFSKLMAQTLKLPLIQNLLACDPVFKKDFEYLYADMNGQVCYMLITFRAIFWKAFDRNTQLSKDTFVQVWEQTLLQLELPKSLKFLYALEKEIFTEETSEIFSQYLINI